MVFSYTPYGTDDKTEFIMTAESIIYDRVFIFIYTPEVDLKRQLFYLPSKIEYYPGGIYLVRNTKDGQVRLGRYSFYCPLFIASFYPLFSLYIHILAFYSYYFLNAILFFTCSCIVIVSLYLHHREYELRASGLVLWDERWVKSFRYWSTDYA
jgi:hypothetical protein